GLTKAVLVTRECGCRQIVSNDKQYIRAAFFLLRMDLLRKRKQEEHNKEQITQHRCFRSILFCSSSCEHDMPSATSDPTHRNNYTPCGVPSAWCAIPLAQRRMPDHHTRY